MPLFLALILLGAITTTASAQDILDLKGTWLGKGKSIVFGSNAHHGGSQTPNDPPRVREIEVTHVVEGQEGNVAWGRSSSAAADTKEPFAWALSNDNRSSGYVLSHGARATIGGHVIAGAAGPVSQKS